MRNKSKKKFQACEMSNLKLQKTNLVIGIIYYLLSLLLAILSLYLKYKY